jgi:hypothetical protein
MAQGFPPLINGHAYSWADVRMNILGVTVAGIIGIKYDDEEEMEDQYGAGNRPVSRGHGNIKCTGSITLLSEEVVALENVAPNGRLQEIPEFDIPVSFLPPSGVVVTHMLKNCRFEKNSRDLKQNAKSFEVEIPLLMSHIIWKP